MPILLLGEWVLYSAFKIRVSGLDFGSRRRDSSGSFCAGGMLGDASRDHSAPVTSHLPRLIVLLVTIAATFTLSAFMPRASVAANNAAAGGLKQVIIDTDPG